jgi:hypothetical protein
VCANIRIIIERIAFYAKKLRKTSLVASVDVSAGLAAAFFLPIPNLLLFKERPSSSSSTS